MIETLKQVLNYLETAAFRDSDRDEAITNLRTLIAQLEKQEPVGTVETLFDENVIEWRKLDRKTKVFFHPAPAVPDRQKLITLFERYAAQRIMAHDYGNKHGDVDASEATWKQFRDVIAAPEYKGQEK